MLLSNCNHSLLGNFAFDHYKSAVTNRSGGAMSIKSNSHISGNISFISDSAAGEGGAVAMYGHQAWILL